MSLVFRQDVLITVDWMETPAEEDESREMEEEEDVFLLVSAYSNLGSVDLTRSSNDSPVDTQEPLYSIIVPPPQG